VVPQPDTVYEGVRTLPPASWMIFDGVRLSQQCYWRLEYAPTLRLPYAEVLERTRTLVGDAVRLRLRSDVPIGVFLSGGVDSSVVVREAARHLGETLQTFTVSVGHAEFDEAPLAAKTAKMLGVRNTVLPLQVSPLEDLQFLVRHYDQPFADSSAIPSYAVSRMAHQHLKVILNGDGGDELFAGYRRYLAANYFDHFRWLPSGAFRFAERCLSACPGGRRSGVGFITRFVRGMGSPPPARFLVWTTDTFFDTEKRRFWKRSPMRPTEQLIAGCQSESLSVLDSQRALDLNFILGSTLLVKMDMATMASSLEARSPLLDHVVAEFTARLPPGFLLRHGRTKAVLRDAYRDQLPPEVVDGRKRGFEIPLVSWLKTELKSILLDTAGSPGAKVRSYLDGHFIDELLTGRTLADRNWGYLVYALLVLELWLRAESDSARSFSPAERSVSPSY